ncbi:hypothetical protein [Nocardioides sp. GXZ039]|uniref:hypothetical protein n=1 Tax=Nocardioides sp. GXZ039 TaxID=3136018 RepID=UPI0030F434FF
MKIQLPTTTMETSMKTLIALALVLLTLGAASRRLATHQALLPEVSSRINTRVIRINQR